MMQGVAWAWAFVVTAGLLSTIGNLCLKKSSTVSAGTGFLGMLLQPYLFCGLFFYGLNVILFAKALQYIEVSKAYPVLAAIGFSALSIAATVIFRESLSFVNCLGLLVILIGIAMLSH